LPNKKTYTHINTHIVTISATIPGEGLLVLFFIRSAKRRLAPLSAALYRLLASLIHVSLSRYRLCVASDYTRSHGLVPFRFFRLVLNSDLITRFFLFIRCIEKYG